MAAAHTVDPRSPCIIGVAQHTNHPEDGDAPEPLELWASMAREAAADSRGHDVIEAIDDVGVVYTMSWQYDDAPGRLAEQLGLKPGGRHYSGMSGTVPQKRVQSAATQILSGRSDVALVTGAEVLATKKRMKKRGTRPEWSFAPSEKRALPFDDPFHPAEMAHQVFQAYLTFAVFDLARRSHLGLTPEANSRQLGELFARMSQTAAANPRAWLRKVCDARELTRVTPDNRMVAVPYTKGLVSVMDIDMASALIVASHEKADALGVPQEQRVYLRGWCHTKDPVYVAERRELWRSAGMAEASRVALACAGVGIDDVAHLDLYSCFGSSVNFALDALGLSSNDARPLTVTGGLPFHGGPGSNYLSHSVATMVEKLRAEPEALGMVSGVGMHMTNHVFAVYSATPGAVSVPDEEAAQVRVDAVERCAIRNTATGVATIAAYSVVHDREGAAWGLAICDLPGGDRCYARVEDASLMQAMEQEEWVGRKVALVDGGKGVNLVAS
jgi:acetyl-CoA C-acetyltransferase